MFREVVQAYVRMQDGSTAVVVAVTSRYIMCANAGDSRAVMLDGDTVIPLSVCDAMSQDCMC